jgi:hypothetical protein
VHLEPWGTKSGCAGPGRRKKGVKVVGQNVGTAEADTVFGRLRRYNAVMGLFHLIQGALLILLSNDATLPITTSYLEYDAVTETLAPVKETIWDLRIAPMVAVFLLISSVAHFVIASPGIFGWYRRNLKKGINYVRWYEYALSSSVMIVIIAMLSGMYDLPSLILIFTLNAMMIFFGLMMELHNQTTKRTNWTAFVFGCIAGIVPWIVIAMYFIGSVDTADGDGGPPTFVYFILGSLAVFWFSFAFNMFLQYKRVGPWRDYVYGERVYVLLSLVAKSALAWQVFGGALAAAEWAP